jgi:negative regulator of sigma E activity
MDDARLLLRNYNVRVLDGDPVAGRNTYLVEVKPKSVGRPSMQLWMDAETAIALKMEKYDTQRFLREFFTYSEISFNPDIDEAVFRDQGTNPDRSNPGKMRDREEIWNHRQGELDLDEVRKETGLNVMLPGQTPNGFILQSVQLVVMRMWKNVHLVYTDGLAIISVFQSPSHGSRRERLMGQFMGRGEETSIDGIECKIITRGQSLIFRWNQDGVSLTLIGELERKDMVEFVKSFVGKRSDPD